ncbi:hypothetical protein SAMN05444679_1064 [Variovorax sp. CF079]|uniref:hypothetical protein n=1 Tax=Variovorax sp. CF079 TaxID=1882774 RepID=UPI00087E6115|nr:hypothetical protein [Variovorax sp. CF079]SDC88761.1 hypothetical protein SAMN05444679_1064 [Variovorax sp. CF079]
MRAYRSLAAIVVASLAMGVSLQACADSKPERSAPKMTAAPAKSNGSGVSVQYRVDGTPQAGSAVSVVLSFDGITDPAGASVRLTAEGGLSLVGAGGTQALPAGQATTLTVQVVPGAEGVGYLHVFTTQRGATSATSVPVQVGKAASAMPASDTLKQTPDGDKIRSMPVK